MIQMIQMIQMIVFSRFLLRFRPARIGPRVDHIGAQSAHPAGENTGTENDSNDSGVEAGGRGTPVHRHMSRETFITHVGFLSAAVVSLFRFLWFLLLFFGRL